MNDPTQKLSTPLEGRLNSLFQNGALKDWRIVAVDDNGVEGQKGKFRNTERLYLTFPDGQKLVIDTFCSGCAENTCFI